MSNEATVASVTALEIALQSHQAALRQPVALDETLRLDNNDRGVPGPLLSRRAMDNLLDADGAVSPVRATAPAQDPRSGLTR